MAGGMGNQSVGSLAPASALAALALGAVVLFAPMPFLRAPEATSARPSLIPNPEPRTKPRPPLLVPEEWSDLAPRLAKLRDTPAPTDLASRTPDTQPTTTTDTEAPTLGPAPLLLRWRYLGWIQEPDRMAALVLMNDTTQRFFYPGQEVVDDTDSESSPIRILSISENELVISRAGVEERFARTIGESTAPSMLPNPLNPPTTSPTTPPGAPRGPRANPRAR